MSLVVEIAVEEPKWQELGDLEGFATQSMEAALRESEENPAQSAEVSLLFCDDARMRVLNRDFRGKDKPTNVLSFPGPDLPEPAPVLGDIALGYETVAREAQQQGKSFADHARHMIVHGFLHLLGYDHETEAEAAEMEAMEIRILQSFGIANPYGDPLQ
ncbi:rRNA maturation RNase YbeY [Rhodoblastus sp.]|uniref:rRNA maturation RNase YbeY n=1 Tax=Rhodoblastus sp. TaxID=1962975 RepID=UPI003F961DA7